MMCFAVAGVLCLGFVFWGLVSGYGGGASGGCAGECGGCGGGCGGCGD